MRDSAPNVGSAALDAAVFRRWTVIEPILDAALDLPPNERAPYMMVASGDDSELRTVVERLLRAAGSVDGDLAIGAAAAYPDLIAHLFANEIAIGDLIGPYRIVGQAGQGGMGIVYVAERADDQYRSRVAVKVIRRGREDGELVRRFLDERQILASLVHPGIARLYDGGVTADGRPWFAMELVEGKPITEYCDSKRLTTTERLRLMLSVCDAVAYAHRNFVIHRDLKPSNILVDDDGRVRIVDFGMAHTPDVAASVSAWTPGYASPELVRGDRVTAASDAYSLGIILYKLLTGHRPNGSNGPEREEPPPALLDGGYVAPSATALRAGPDILGSRRTSAWRLARRLRGDLDAVVLKAIAAERERRYATVEEFATDIRAHMAGRPVTVRPGRWGYRSTKFITRNLMGVAAGVTIIMLSTAFAISMRAQLLRVDEERRVMEQVSSFLSGLIASGNPLLGRGGEAVTMREVLEQALKKLNKTSLRAAARARVYDEIGYALWQQERHDRAQQAFDSAIAVGTRARLAPADLWGTRARLASVLLETGQLAAAESVLRELLAEQRRATGESSASVSLTLSYLGEVLAGLGRAKDAVHLVREALAIQQALANQANPAHILPDLALTQWLLASILMDSELSRDRQYITEAESLSVAALATALRAHGDKGPRIERFYTTVARVQHRRGNPTAEAYLRAIHERHRVLWGENHPFLDRERLALAEIVADRGALSEAESLFAGIAHRMRTRSVRPAAFDTVLIGLGRVKLDRGKADQAETVLREVVELRQRVFQPGDPRIAEAQVLLGTACVTLRCVDEGEALMRTALPIVERRWGNSDRRAVKARAALEQVWRATAKLN